MRVKTANLRKESALDLQLRGHHFFGLPQTPAAIRTLWLHSFTNPARRFVDAKNNWCNICFCSVVELARRKSWDSKTSGWLIVRWMIRP
jgi:hypothetical protein